MIAKVKDKLEKLTRVSHHRDFLPLKILPQNGTAFSISNPYYYWRRIKKRTLIMRKLIKELDKLLAKKPELVRDSTLQPLLPEIPFARRIISLTEEELIPAVEKDIDRAKKFNEIETELERGGRKCKMPITARRKTRKKVRKVS